MGELSQLIVDNCLRDGVHPSTLNPDLVAASAVPMAERPPSSELFNFDPTKYATLDHMYLGESTLLDLVCDQDLMSVNDMRSAGTIDFVRYNLLHDEITTDRDLKLAELRQYVDALRCYNESHPPEVTHDGDRCSEAVSGTS